MKIKNPIIRGFSPDPSICQKDGWYYMCSSSFSVVPGIPIYRSRDLCHWEQIGNAITADSGLDYDDSRFSGGVFAPTIRYHKGKFYIVNSFHCANGGNYYITAEDPAGPWSKPKFCLGYHSDPELFFDDDGKSYLVAVRPDTSGKRHEQDNELYGWEFDLETDKFIGEPFPIWNGALNFSYNLEGPHLYKINGYYYIMGAEGGTGEDHSVVIARSRDIKGPYESCPKNPIATHRHFGGVAPFHRVGHADMFEAADGNWYMVLLGCRRCDGYILMGRETLIARVDWIDGWPCVNRGFGMITEEIEGTLPEYPLPCQPDIYDFKKGKLPLEWVQLRGGEPFYEFTGEGLCLNTRPERLGERVTPSFLAVRQREFDSVFETCVKFGSDSENESAGLAYVHSDENFIRFEICGNALLRVIKCVEGVEKTLYMSDIKSKNIILRINTLGLTMSFEYRTENDGDFCSLPVTCGLSDMSYEKDITFLGNLIGIYTSSNGIPSQSKAVFEYFSIK